MNSRRLICLFILVSASLALAVDRPPVAPPLPETNPPHDTKAPQVDTKRIVNQSNSFLKDKEPDMSAEEYALYEKVVDMLSVNPGLAVKMLESMGNEKEKPSPAFDLILGNAYYATNQYEQAEKRLRSATNRLPSFLRAWTNLGILYYSTGRFPLAIECLSKAVVLGDHDSSTFGLLGYCLEKQGDLISAEMAYMQALSGEPSNSDWKDGLLRIYIAGKQYGRAEALIRTLVKEKPAEKQYWLSYVNILLTQSRKFEAAVILDTAASASLLGPEDLVLLGDLYAEQHLVSDAIRIYQASSGSTKSRSNQKLIQFAETLISAGKFDDAAKALEAVATTKPDEQVEYLQTRADLFVAQAQWAKARAELDALLKIAPMNGQALLTLGHTYTEEHDLPHATVIFETAVQIPDSTYRASLELANIELQNHHYGKSAQYLEKAIGIQKSDTLENYLTRIKALAREEPHSAE